LLDIADVLALVDRDVSQLGDIEAVEIIASINGMETIWLLVPSIPLTPVFKQ
jgi:hypothetical protein